MKREGQAAMAAQLQEVNMSEADVARALTVAGPANDKTRGAADALLRFEDEPGTYYALLADHGSRT